MAKYLKKFTVESEYNAYISGGTAYIPNVSLIGTTDVRYNPTAPGPTPPGPTPSPYASMPLTLEVTYTDTTGRLILVHKSSNENATLFYKKNDDEWTEVDTESVQIQVVKDDKIQFKGLNNFHPFNAGGSGSGSGSIDTPFIGSYGTNYVLYGNIMSVVYGDNFSGATEFPSTDFNFSQMFCDSECLTSVENLILPATALTDYCYAEMFSGCTSLTTAPVLPATTLAQSCYAGMFNGCTSLTTAPELPATTLTNYCYSHMFYGCTSLTTAPELPATTLVEQCYGFMFEDCSSLNLIKCLATNVSANYYTWCWVEGVSSSGTFIKNPDMSNWTTGYNGIPEGWTIEDAS